LIYVRRKDGNCWQVLDSKRQELAGKPLLNFYAETSIAGI
jgi:hypothetical protein